MDDLAFARLCEVERQFDHPHKDGDREITLRFKVPTEDEFLMLMGSVPREHSGNELVLQGVFVPACLIGWSGIKRSDLHKDGGDTELGFAEPLKKFVLTRFRAAVRPAFVELDRRYAEQRRLSETETKN